ncbi:MAG: hypothetical protein ICV64_07250 [Thermoleophilia bacterium]|nr:hypothetical protein [Thermoleophilia bacterium]
MAERLSAAYGLRHYRPDRLEREHAARVDPHRDPAMARWAARSLDETWVDMAPADLAAETLAYSRERFELILEDVLDLADERPVLAEGFQVDPGSLAAVLADRRRAVWLIPDEAFRRAVFVRRLGIWDTPRRTSDPERAQRNRLARDAIVARELRAAALSHGFRVLDVTTTPLEQVARAVERQFAPFLPARRSTR